MRIAIAEYAGRVSPVLDVARTLLLVEMDGSVERSRRSVSLHGEAIPVRVSGVVAAGPDVLICGAVSRPLATALRVAGVEVIPQVCGAVDEVLGAYLSGQLESAAYLMPGCCGRGRLRGRGRGFGGRGRWLRQEAGE